MSGGIVPPTWEAWPDRMRELVCRVLGTTISEHEPLAVTMDNLEAYLEERDRWERRRSERNEWAFSDVPELVVQVIDSRGVRTVARLAGGPAQAELDDPMQRAYARMLLKAAVDRLDETEPNSTIGVGR